MGNVLQVFHKLRPGVVAPLLVGPVQAVIPVAGVRLCHTDREQLCSRFLLHPACQLLHIPRGDDAGGRHGVHIFRQDGVIRPGKVGHKDIAFLCLACPQFF